jgi:hypothetical protein
MRPPCSSPASKAPLWPKPHAAAIQAHAGAARAEHETDAAALLELRCGCGPSLGLTAAYVCLVPADYLLRRLLRRLLVLLPLRLQHLGNPPELRMQLRRVRCHDYRIVGIHIRAADIVGIQLGRRLAGAPACTRALLTAAG